MTQDVYPSTQHLSRCPAVAQARLEQTQGGGRQPPGNRFRQRVGMPRFSKILFKFTYAVCIDRFKIVDVPRRASMEPSIFVAPCTGSLLQASALDACGNASFYSRVLGSSPPSPPRSQNTPKGAGFFLPVRTAARQCGLFGPCAQSCTASGPSMPALQSGSMRSH